MGLYKFSLTLAKAFMVMSMLLHFSTAQNSPQDYVDAHNVARAEVGVGHITWDDNLAAYAQSYANRRAGDCAMMHSSGPYGENIARGTPNFMGIDAVNMWIGEKPFYDHNSNTCTGGECGHYTQVVWSNSIKLGCARVQCNNGMWFVTCNYDPQGNFPGETPY